MKKQYSHYPGSTASAMTQTLALCLIWLFACSAFPVFAQTKAPAPASELSVEFGSGLHFFNVSGYRGKVGEYDVLKSGADSTFSIVGNQGKNYFDANGQFFAADDQSYSFNVDMQRLFTTEFSYKKFIHYLDHDTLANQDSYTDNNPGPCYSRTMVSMEGAGKILLFGGRGGRLYDTWIWDGTNWLEQHPLNSPDERIRYAMAYDSFRKEVVLFGGEGKTVFYNDTWIWDENNWIKKTPVHKPDFTCGSAMAFDSIRKKIVMFGGFTADFIDNTWEWDGNDWTEVFPEHKPSPRGYMPIFFDNSFLALEIITVAAMVETSPAPTKTHPTVSIDWPLCEAE